MIFVFTTTISGFSQESKPGKEIKTVKIKASMQCGSCKERIEKNIAFEKGVKDVVADVETKIVTIKFRSDKNTPENLAKAIEELGYATEIIPEEKTDIDVKKE
ncbi:MAG: heavy-metal-associated domain-containing protein [Bacteroidia bacterium]|nr:heavy-metal-associated domain-containing protein [Bacteroidia bacterium]